MGYTAEATPDELASLADRGYIAGDRVGRAGLERVAETHLAGARGSRLDVLEPSGIVVTTLATVPPRHGGTVVTTLDLDLQRVAEAALGERLGSVVAICLPGHARNAAAGVAGRRWNPGVVVTAANGIPTRRPESGKNRVVAKRTAPLCWHVGPRLCRARPLSSVGRAFPW